MIRKVLLGVRNIWPVFLVAVAVALASTLAGSVLDHKHQVDAEALNGTIVPAVLGADGTQLLQIKDWGVQVTLPLAPELSFVRYASHGGSSIGLSSQDLEKFGSACAATRNTLGSLIRFSRGTTVAPGSGVLRYLIATVGDYDFYYQMPQNSCTAIDGAGVAVNRETSIIREALGSLTPLEQQ